MSRLFFHDATCIGYGSLTGFRAPSLRGLFASAPVTVMMLKKPPGVNSVNTRTALGSTNHVRKIPEKNYGTASPMKVR